MATEPERVAIVVTVHADTAAVAAKASELLTMAVSALALDGISARMTVRRHDPAWEAVRRQSPTAGRSVRPIPGQD